MKRPRASEATKKALYCYICGEELNLSGARKTEVKHILERHTKELSPTSPAESWLAKKEHPEDAPIFRSPIKGQQLFANTQRRKTHWWWYPAEDWETRRWEYVGPLPDDPAYRQGPPHPLPPNVVRRLRQAPSEEMGEEAMCACRTAAAKHFGDNVNGALIAQVARLVGDHFVKHPHQAGQLLAALGYDCSEEQVGHIGGVVRGVAKTFFAEPSTPIEWLQTTQALLSSFITPYPPSMEAAHTDIHSNQHPPELGSSSVHATNSTQQPTTLSNLPIYNTAPNRDSALAAGQPGDPCASSGSAESALGATPPGAGFSFPRSDADAMACGDNAPTTPPTLGDTCESALGSTPPGASYSFLQSDAGAMAYEINAPTTLPNDFAPNWDTAPDQPGDPCESALDSFLEFDAAMAYEDDSLRAWYG